jgi:exopolyphosphatase / guanosine-5'-triphosphate,3'-diphosphate pyrophosphatase
MQALNVEKVDICPWALREGIMLHYLQSQMNQTWALPLTPMSPDEPDAPSATVHHFPVVPEEPSG